MKNILKHESSEVEQKKKQRKIKTNDNIDG